MHETRLLWTQSNPNRYFRDNLDIFGHYFRISTEKVLQLYRVRRDFRELHRMKRFFIFSAFWRMKRGGFQGNRFFDFHLVLKEN